jgi:UDP-glucose 4-epimerase
VTTTANAPDSTASAQPSQAQSETRPTQGSPLNVLVVGGAGYIGSVVARFVLADGHSVTVLDDLSTGHRDAVPADASFVEGDISSAGELFATQRFDAVIHLAAKSLVGESVLNPSLYWHTNVGGSRALLDAMTTHRVPVLVFSSTAATYGEPDAVPITEDFPTKPTNTYGATKLAVDMMITGETVATDLAAVSLRYFNVAGAALGAGERHGVETHLIPVALQALLGKRDKLTVYGDDWPTRDGTPLRDYVHVADLARAHVLALTAAQPGEHLICNLGCENGYSVKEVIAAVEKVTGLDMPVTTGPRRAGDPARLVASYARAKDRLGWEPQLDLETMVRDAWNFTRERENLT